MRKKVKRFDPTKWSIEPMQDLQFIEADRTKLEEELTKILEAESKAVKNT